MAGGESTQQCQSYDRPLEFRFQKNQARISLRNLRKMSLLRIGPLRMFVKPQFLVLVTVLVVAAD